MSPNHMAITTYKLRFRYSSDTPAAHDVLQDLNLSIPTGGVTAVLGPNGVGKTTLLNLMLGWLRPTDGRIELFNRPQHEFSRREMGRTLSLLPQEEHVPFEYSVMEYVLLGRTPYLPPLSTPRHRDVHIASEALERVGLRGRSREVVTEISGGERQLVMLARCLTQQPRVLLMDEPTSHLDLANRRRLADLIRTLVHDGTTVVFTTHDPEFAAICADHLVLMSGGRLLAHGPKAETMTAPLLSEVFGLKVGVATVGDRPVVLW